MFEICVLHFLPKGASNGVMSIVLFEILNRCLIAYSDYSKLSAI